MTATPITAEEIEDMCAWLRATHNKELTDFEKKKFIPVDSSISLEELDKVIDDWRPYYFECACELYGYILPKGELYGN